MHSQRFSAFALAIESALARAEPKGLDEEERENKTKEKRLLRVVGSREERMDFGVMQNCDGALIFCGGRCGGEYTLAGFIENQ